MARGRTTTVLTTRVRNGAHAAHPDRVVVEEPLEIRLDDRTVTVTMRTPGHDYELAAGFCLTEGLLATAPVREVRYCATGPASETFYNVVTVSTDGMAPEPPVRLHTATSSCGVCGTASLEQLQARLAPLGPPPEVPDMGALAAVGAASRARQELFDATGGIHAAASFRLDSCEILCVREDIGRHNAVDKVVGHHLLEGGLPADAGIWVSGRASFEIVQKAWAAGFGLVAAVSAASSLAIETAVAAGITLIGFLRDDGGAASANIYAPAPALRPANP